jgi:IS4 transposase
LEASEIAAIYKHRWLIELHFKWLKQHVRLTKLYSTKPQAIWNQMFLALLAHALTLYIQLKTKTN